MITTISLNPSIDRTVDVEHFQIGRLNRVLRTQTAAAGKGINVALCAAALGERSECIGLMFREGAELFERRLTENGTAFEFVRCEGRVRTNIKVRDGSEITEINERGVPVTEEALARMTELVRRRAEKSDCLILTGSMPPECPPDYYAQLICEAKKKGCFCILDADGEAMRLGLEAKPDFIKPNRFELERITGRPLNRKQDIRDAALRLIDGGVGAAAVSLGEAGAMMIGSGQVLYAPKIDVKVASTVGAGDAMAAGFACAFAEKQPMEEAFRRAVACAAARCMTDAERIIAKDDCEALMNRVEIQRL